MRDNLSRIAGWGLLVCALVLLIFSPPGFSLVHFYIFIFCFACGILLATGMIGTHPLAARLRRAAVRTVPPRMGPLCPVPEQMFPYAGSPYKRKLVACTCFVIGLCLTGLGILAVYFFPSRAVDIIPAGIPLWACGILCLWIAIRYPTRYVQVTPQAITLKGYFQSVTMPWQSVLALIAEKRFILVFGGFVSAGVMYSLYSGRLKLSFSSHLPGSERLASLVSEATGLTWNPKPVCRSK